jgi:hypothetical protein
MSNYIIWDGSARTGTLGFLRMDYLQWKTQMRSKYFSHNVLAGNINRWKNITADGLFRKKCKKHGGFPTEVSDMARNMKMELLTFSLILYQSKNCGHRIHVLFMMYDVYWYCQLKKKRMIVKILKKEWFIWKFWKRGGGSRENGGRRKRNPCPMRLCHVC